MKRDWDIIRLLMLKQEESSEEIEKALKEFNYDEVLYNSKLLIENGYLEGIVIQDMSFPSGVADVNIFSLTWDGHELLDSMKNPGIWTKMKSVAVDKGIDMTFETVKLLFTNVVKSMLS